MSAESPRPVESGSAAGAVSAETGARHVIEECTRRGLTLAACESLTAGLVSARLADVPGASAVLRGGLVTYATDLKASLAGVDPARLEQTGPVDGEVARQMAEGARRACGADLGVATTGVAGPDPVGEQEAGTVWIAVTGLAPRRLSLPGDRAAVRAGAAEAAIALVAEALRHVPERGAEGGSGEAPANGPGEGSADLGASLSPSGN